MAAINATTSQTVNCLDKCTIFKIPHLSAFIYFLLNAVSQPTRPISGTMTKISISLFALFKFTCPVGGRDGRIRQRGGFAGWPAGRDQDEGLQRQHWGSTGKPRHSDLRADVWALSGREGGLWADVQGGNRIGALLHRKTLAQHHAKITLT